MSVGNMEAFPQPMTDANGRLEIAVQHGHGGMSYRQWLIGMALNGCCGDPDRNGEHDNYAHDAIKFADAIIARLDAENAK